MVADEPVLPEDDASQQDACQLIEQGYHLYMGHSYQQAGQAFHRAWKQGAGLDPELASQTLAGLASCAFELGRYPVAVQLYRQLWALSSKGHTPEHRLQVLHMISKCLCKQGSYQEAEPLQRNAVALFIKLHGVRDKQTVEALDTLVEILEKQGKKEEADRLQQSRQKLSPAGVC